MRHFFVSQEKRGNKTIDHIYTLSYFSKWFADKFVSQVSQLFRANTCSLCVEYLTVALIQRTFTKDHLYVCTYKHMLFVSEFSLSSEPKHWLLREKFSVNWCVKEYSFVM